MSWRQRSRQFNANARPTAPASLLAGIVGRIETAPSVDRVGGPLNAALHRLLRPGPAVDALSGKALGHPAHPALVSAPIGCWTGALVADLAGEPRAGQLLTGLGVAQRFAGSRNRCRRLGRHQRRGTAGGRRPPRSQPDRHRPLRRVVVGPPPGPAPAGAGIGSSRSDAGYRGRMAGRPPGVRPRGWRRHQRLRWRPHRMDVCQRSIWPTRAGRQRVGGRREPGHRRTRPG